VVNYAITTPIHRSLSVNEWPLPGVIEVAIYGRTKKKIQKFNGMPIWGSYHVDVRLQASDREWTIGLMIRVSDLGTPTLNSLDIRSGMRSLAENKSAPFIMSYLEEKQKKGANLDDIIGELGILGSAYYELDFPSVERWQIKFVEQNRHTLMQMAIVQGLKDCTLELGLDLETINERIIDSKIRQKITPDFLKQIAFFYENAASNGENPIKNIEILFQASERTVQNWATQARAQGFLPPTTQGKVTTKKKNGVANEKRNR